MKSQFQSLVFALSALTLATPLYAASAKLKNGAELLVEQDSRSPRDFVAIGFLGGSSLIKPDEQGLAPLLSAILNEGPEGVSNEEFKKQLFVLGGEVSFSISTRQTFINVVAPSENLGKVIDLALQTVKKPKLDAENYKVALAKVTAGVAMQEDNMMSQLRYYAMRDAFQNHPDVLDGNTSRASLKNLSLAKTKAILPKVFDARYLITAAVGPTDASQFESVLNSELEKHGFLAAKLEKRTFVTAAKDAKPTGKKIVLLNKPGATDNQLRYIIRRKIPLDTPEMVSFELANKALGDGMQGALFRVLREQRGLTYSAGSGVGENLGYWTVVSFASTDKLGKLMSGIDEVVSGQAKAKIDAHTAELLKTDALTKWKENRELPADRLMNVLENRIYSRDLAFQEAEDEYIAKASEADITKAGQQYFSVKDAYIYVMGDKTKLLPVFKSLGYKDKDVRVVEPNQVL